MNSAWKGETNTRLWGGGTAHHEVRDCVTSQGKGERDAREEKYGNSLSSTAWQNQIEDASQLYQGRHSINFYPLSSLSGLKLWT